MSKGFRNITKDIFLLETPAGGVWSGIVFIDGEKKFLIDSGESAKHIDELLIPALKTMGYTLNDIDFLCNTHCHGDHVGGHARIRELSDAKVAAYEEAVEKIKDPLKYSKRIRAAFPEYSPAAPAVLRGVEPDVVLKDEEILAGRLQVIATPGHDTDCVSFYDLKTKTLITGDSLQGNGTSTQGTALYMDLDSYISSLKKLMQMDIENIVSGHPYLFSGDAAYGKGAVEEYLKKCMEITEIYGAFIKKQVSDGIADAPAIAEALISYMQNQRPAFLFLPLYTVSTHLRALGL